MINKVLIENKMSTSEKYVHSDLAVLLPDAQSAYEKHVASVIDMHKEEIEAMLVHVVEPFKPFAKVGACVASNVPCYYLDEDAYVAAAESGNVPSLPKKEDALAYLASRKMQVLKCCGFAHPCAPRLFGK